MKYSKQKENTMKNTIEKTTILSKNKNSIGNKNSQLNFHEINQYLDDDKKIKGHTERFLLIFDNQPIFNVTRKLRGRDLKYSGIQKQINKSILDTLEACCFNVTNFDANNKLHLNIMTRSKSPFSNLSKQIMKAVHGNKTKILMETVNSFEEIANTYKCTMSQSLTILIKEKIKEKIKDNDNTKDAGRG